MAENNNRAGEVIKFLRRRDYKLVRELGHGACGQTILLHDDQIDQYFVCKKYVPYSSSVRHELFANFVREIKLLHQVHHDNVVRVFNYYLYPDQVAGYILMEYIDGSEIDEFLAQNPERTNEVFLQAIGGFGHLERSGILHRDIRTANLLVRSDGILKIIDLGFGKRVDTSADFDKSITLNWWCETPEEFGQARYDFCTEVYFVGKLFERIIQENEISHFKYADLLRRMCQRSPAARIGTFAEIEHAVRNDPFFEIEFAQDELDTYQRFAEAIAKQIATIERATKYVADIARIQNQLSDVYRSFMLEGEVPDAVLVLRCFINGKYRYRKPGLPVWTVRDFLILLKSSTEEKKRLILANLHTKLDATQRYSDEPDDEVPF